jgi:iduronate 2-sulfatase
MKTLRPFLLLALFLSGLLRAAAPARPNVLLICVDDLKPLLGCYGDPTAKTPNLDRLAARGTRFDRAYCNQAVCAPSRNSLMTGLRPTSTGIYDLPTNFRVATPDAVTVTQYFQSHGWRAEGMGKIMHRGHGNFEDAASWSVPHWNSSTGTYVTKEALAIKQAAAAGQTGPAVAKGDPAAKGYRPANANGPAVEIADVPDNVPRRWLREASPPFLRPAQVLGSLRPGETFAGTFPGSPRGRSRLRADLLGRTPRLCRHSARRPAQ